MAAKDEVVALKGEVRMILEENATLRDRLHTLESAMLFEDRGNGG